MCAGIMEGIGDNNEKAHRLYCDESPVTVVKARFHRWSCFVLGIPTCRISTRLEYMT